MLKISIMSRVMDFLGRTIIGNPEKILVSNQERDFYKSRNVPIPKHPNFYLDPGDRQMPHADAHTHSVKRKMIYENQMRLQVSHYTALYMTLLAIVVVGAVAVGSSTLNMLLAGLVVAGFVWGFYKRMQMPSLASLMPIEKMQLDAWAETNAVSRRGDVPHGKNTAPDLDDVEGRFNLTPEGYRVTGRLLVEDMMHGSYSPINPLLLGLLPFMVAIVGLGGVINPMISIILALGVLYLYVKQIGFMFFFLMAIAGVAFMFLLNTVVGDFVPQSMREAFVIFTKYWYFAIPALAPLVYTQFQGYKRARILAAQGKMANAASQGRLSAGHITARAQQAANSIMDKTKFIRFGTSSGLATKKGDGFSPDANKPFGVTIKDLTFNFIAFGATGTGKTYGSLMPILREVMTSTIKIGLLILDNKGALPDDMKGVRDDYKVLDPEQHDVSMLEGLSAEERAAAFLAVVAAPGKGGKENEFFTSSGKIATRHVFQIHKALVDWDLEVYKEQHEFYSQFLAGIENPTQEQLDELPEAPTLTWLDNFVNLFEVHRLMYEVAPEGELNFLTQVLVRMQEDYEPASTDPLLMEAIQFVVAGMPQQDEKTRQNIKSTTDSWFDLLKSNSKIYRWLNCVTGVDVSKVLEGAAYGLNTPFHKYQDAGLIASNMIKERVYSIARNRKDMKDWTPEDPWTQMVLCIDECQETISPSEDRMFAVARSKGVIGVFATQSINALRQKLGAEITEAFLGNIASFITYRATPDTYKYFQARIGQTENTLYRSQSMGIDYNYTTQLALGSPEYDPAHPQGRFMRSMLRKKSSFKPLGKVSQWLGLAERGDFNIVTQVEHKTQELFDLAEIDQYLQTPFAALAQVQRAGIRRRDFINCEAVDMKTGDRFGAAEIMRKKLEQEMSLAKVAEEKMTTPPVITKDPNPMESKALVIEEITEE